MAQNWCLSPILAEQFKQGLGSGAIDPGKLNKMTTEERKNFLAQYVGEENAHEVNLNFEKKLLLKNQEQAMIKWARETAGITDERRAALIEKIQENARTKEQRVLSPSEEQSFLADLAETKVGVGVSREEAKQIFDLTAKSRELKSSYNEKAGSWGDENKKGISKKGLEYGASVRAAENYVNDLKEQANKVGIKERIKHPIESIKAGVRSIPDLAISLKASLDDSFLGRQGIMSLFRGIFGGKPQFAGEWGKVALGSFRDIAKTLVAKNSRIKAAEIEDALWADIYSRPNYMNGNYQKAGVLKSYVEQYPTSLPGKIPVISRPFNASEVAFKLSSLRMKTDLFDMTMDIAKKWNESANKKYKVNLNDPYELKSMGKVTNSMVALSSFGKQTGTGPLVKTFIWSPKMLMSDISTLTAFRGQDVSRFAKRQAAENLMSTIIGSAAILGTAYALNPKSVDFDPRSADFGKIKVGNTRIGIVPRGMSSIVTLATRLLFGVTGLPAIKSSTTGEIKKINDGPFSKNGIDIITDFLTNKTSPIGSVIVSHLIGKDKNGNPPTLFSDIENLLVPIPVTNAGNKTLSEATRIWTGILDGLGASTNTYGGKEDITSSQVYDAVTGDDIGNNYQLIDSFLRRGATSEDLQKLLDSYATEHPGKTEKSLQNQKDRKKALSAMVSATVDINKKEYKPNNKAPKNIWESASLGLKGIVKDPENVLKALFTKERLQEVYGNVATLQRQDYLGLLDKGDKGTQIDHKIALALGGDNSPQNLQILSNEDNAAKGKLEAYLTSLLRDNKISKQEAQNIDKKWKDYVDSKSKKVLKDKIISN